MPASDELACFIVLKPSLAVRAGLHVLLEIHCFISPVRLLLLLHALDLVASLVVRPISDVICLKAEVCSSYFNSIEFLL